MVSKFVKGSSTFTCGCCRRLTRFTGDQAVGSKLCPQCWDLAGYENQLSDDGELDDSTKAHVRSVYAELKAKEGADFVRVVLDTAELFQHVGGADAEGQPTEAPAPAASGFQYASKAELAAMDASTRAAYRKARRSAAKAARRAKGE